jgi:tetratricopeptide (TPR) repeat protein
VTATRPRWDPDTLARLEHERDLLLRELRELDDQRAAGEIDAARFEAVHGALTARAAATITAVADGRRHRPTRTARPGVAVATAAGLVVAAVAAGLLLADQMAPRVPPAPPVAADAADGDARVARLAAVVDERPDDVPARAALARLLLQEQDLVAAQEQFEAITELDPDHAEALAYSGWLATLGGDPAQGLDRLDRAIAADPTYPDARAFRGLTLMRSGDEGAAIDELQTYLDLAPDGPLAGEIHAVIERLRGPP